MVRQPAQPASEGSAVFIDGHDAWAWVTEEGSVGEDEAEIGEVLYDGAGLHAEDVAGYAAAVEAEDAGCGEVGGG